MIDTKEQKIEGKNVYVLTLANSVAINEMEKAFETIDTLAKLNNQNYAMILVGTNSTSETEFVNLL